MCKRQQTEEKDDKAQDTEAAVYVIIAGAALLKT
jgi:hypothetical protein